MTHELASWLTERGPERQQVPATSADWSTFVQQVRKNGLAGLVLHYARLRGHELPDDVDRSLQDHAAATAADNISTLTQLEGVLSSLRTSGVDGILLKGAALQLSGVYDRPDLRAMSDADLLVRPVDVGRTIEALHRAGCRRGFDLIREDFFPRYHYEAEFLTAAPRPLRIDLHARPFHPLRFARTIPDDAFFENAKAVSAGEAEALVPRDELMLVHLGTHAAFHGFQRLRWLYDIKRFVDRGGASLDWDLLADRCARWRLSLPVCTALEAVRSQWPEFDAEAGIAQLKRHRAGWQDRLVLRMAPRLGESAVVHIGTNLLTTPGIGFRLGYLRAVLTPDARHPRRHLPAPSLGLAMVRPRLAPGPAGPPAHHPSRLATRHLTRPQATYFFSPGIFTPRSLATWTASS